MLVRLVRTAKAALFCGIVGLLVVACASKDAYKNIDNAVYKNEFEIGVEAIVKAQEGKKVLYPETNAIALYLDKGMLEYYAGNASVSSQDLLEADRLMEEAYTKSVTQNLASYIANDNTKDYAGEDFENIYISVFNALNFYKQGNIDGALVEIRKLTLSSGKLDMLSRKYEDSRKKVGAGAMNSLAKFSLSLSDALPDGGVPIPYKSSALAQYLSGLFYISQGNTDSARISFDAVAKAFADNPNVYTGAVPKAVEQARNVPAGKARLNVIAFTGLSPVKEEAKFMQNWFFMQNVMQQHPVFKLPIMVDRPNSIKGVTVSVLNGETFELELIEDMGAVVKETFKNKFADLFLKTYMRVLTKYIASDVASQAAADQNAWAGLATSLVGKIASDVSEGADIRMGRYFPDKAYVGGINLDPGNYTVIVKFSSGKHQEFNVNVKAGNANLIDAACLR